MARRQVIYKIDVTDLEQDVALANVVGDKERETLIRTFCKIYSIPLGTEQINTLIITMGEIKQALIEGQNSKTKK